MFYCLGGEKTETMEKGSALRRVAVHLKLRNRNNICKRKSLLEKQAFSK